MAHRIRVLNRRRRRSLATLPRLRYDVDDTPLYRYLKIIIAAQPLTEATLSVQISPGGDVWDEVSPLIQDARPISR